MPTPKDILGYSVGAPNKLTYTADQQRYFRTLEKSLPGRVKTMVAGKTEEGREILIAFISSEENLKNLEVNRQNLKKLADPRGLSETDIQKLIASTKPHYHVSAGLHSAETSPPESILELGYRLAVSEEPYIRQIRDNVVVSITPSTDLDGRDRAVDWYYAYRSMNCRAAGKTTAAHRIGAGTSLRQQSRYQLRRRFAARAPELVSQLGAANLARPPRGANAAVYLQWTAAAEREPRSDSYTSPPFFATYEVNKLTSYGMPGVWHFGFVDTWSPGYLAFAASNHNGMLRMYEIFNQGGANTESTAPRRTDDP